ncbi:MAG: hypothetical protein LJE87_09970 [Deltaproteobacteria bacterium]|nr:hypothetical protein [Deltaproteobacteria bacterium]
MSTVGSGLKSFRRKRRLFSLAVVSRPGKNNILCVLCASVVNLHSVFLRPQQHGAE